MFVVIWAQALSIIEPMIAGLGSRDGISVTETLNR